MIKAILMRLRFLQLSFKAPFGICLGDEVLYNGKIWFVSNGVYRPSWSLVRGLGTEYHEYEERVDESLFVKRRTFKNHWHGFSSRYGFYMDNWYSILIRKDWRVIFRRPIHGWLK